MRSSKTAGFIAMAAVEPPFRNTAPAPERT